MNHKLGSLLEIGKMTFKTLDLFLYGRIKDRKRRRKIIKQEKKKDQELIYDSDQKSYDSWS